MGRNEKPATETALAVIGADLTPAVVYGTENGQGMNAILDKIIAEVRSAVIDVSTKAGREAANSLAFKVARSKTVLDDMGKDLVADWKSRSAKVDAERKIIRDRLDVLKAEVKKPVDDWEAAEADRVGAHVNAIIAIEDLVRFDGEPTAALIADRISRLDLDAVAKRDWQEFGEQAAAAIIMIRTQLTALREVAVKRAADAAELEALRAEKAERDAADRAASDAAAKAAREAQEAEAAAAREHQRARQAERDQEAAAARAVETERQRVADEQAAEQEAAAKRERNKKHRVRVMATAAAAIKAAAELTDDQAAAVVKAIALGLVPSITISF